MCPRNITNLQDTSREDFVHGLLERKPYKDNTQQVGIHSTYSGPDNKIDLQRGTPITDWWTDINTVTGWCPENVGFPTQKPVKLYGRIILASSNPGDMVLDPFCGCATTLIAAEKHKRQWVGIDIWRGAYDVVINRIKDEGFLRGPDGSTSGPLFTEGDITYTREPPSLTMSAEHVPYLETLTRKGKPRGGWRSWTKKEMKRRLIEAQADRKEKSMVICAGCGRSVEHEFMDLDHIIPKSGGGKNSIDNRTCFASHVTHSRATIERCRGCKPTIARQGGCETRILPSVYRAKCCDS